MLGWEFPPYFAGGVGTVCYQLTKGLAEQGVHVTYLMPHGPDEAHSEHVKLLVADREVAHRGLKTLRVRSLLTPYVSKEEYGFNVEHLGSLMPRAKKLYGQDLMQEVQRFAAAVVAIAADEDFDVIHAHDWTTVPAAIALRNATGKPLIVHAHITEFDKTGGEHADPDVYRIEYDGFHEADRVIAVSNFLKRRLMERYYVPGEKIDVIHNAVEGGLDITETREVIREDEKIVLFLGRVTLQKGPDYFLEAARKVVDVMPNVKFIMAGTGDMLPRIIERAADMGLGNKIIFAGFVSREEGDRLYRMADIFVMPSVSEPFGIVPLEAMKQGTPVIISRQSGVSEVISHALKVDFWDTTDLASKIVAALSYSELHSTMEQHTREEIKGFTWTNPAAQCKRLYEEIAW